MLIRKEQGYELVVSERGAFVRGQEGAPCVVLGMVIIDKGPSMIGEEQMVTAGAANVAQVELNYRRFREWNQNPVYKLSVGLLNTYLKINEGYYAARRRAQQVVATASETNEDGDFIINPGGEVGEHRYRIESRLGKGSFGQVVLAIDTKTEKEVAIKIIKAKKAFTKQAQIEIRLLQKLNELDKGERGLVVRLLDSFMHGNHQCLVFEKLAINLYDLLRSTQFKGISFDLIRKFARQILTALAFFARPDVDIIHCDLKPENILLCEPRRSAIKIIDFGSSCTSKERIFTYIQSRFYRSPEVILGCKYSYPIDMWSLGCILIEMHVGEPLFAGQTEKEQMHLLVSSRGMPPAEMLQEGSKVSSFFEEYVDEANVKKLRLKPLPQRPKPLRPTTIEQALGISTTLALDSPLLRALDSPFLRASKFKKESLERYQEFADLLDKMLNYSPEQRITPAQALLHPFLRVDASSVTSAPPQKGSRMPPPPMPQRDMKSNGRYDPPKRPFSQ